MSTVALGLFAALAITSAQGQDTVPLYDNLGDYHHAITTSSPRAQQYFDQGLRLTYGFNHAEAIRSFEEARRLDPSCAMCSWGIAFAYGPNINAAMDSASAVAAYDAAQKALALADRTSPVEQALIRALAKRYGKDPVADRARHDSAYATAMRELARTYPDDDEAQVLFADAVMNLSPWKYWTEGPAPRPGTLEMVESLERVTQRNPKHAGACHLYIHAVEDAYAKRAEPCADRLAGLMPGAGHIVHMPAHIFIRVGRWADAIRTNQHAIHEDESFIADRKPTGMYPLGYYPHNYAFLNFAAMMAGDEAMALETGRALASKVDRQLMLVPALGFLQHYLLTPSLTLIRFERWADVLAEPAPPEAAAYANALWRYTRGVALARQGKLQQAEAELAEFRRLAATPGMDQVAMMGYNSGAAVLGVAGEELAGEIAIARGNAAEGIARLRKAVELEDAFVYIEPPEWLIPPRHRLGAALLAAKRPAEAAQVFTEDLEVFVENGWSLRGLAQSLEAQGKTAEAEAARKRFRAAWPKAPADHSGHH